MTTQTKPEMGKYLLWCYFHKNKGLRKYLPETKRYSLDALTQLLNKYSGVYIKPVAGSRGNGILKAWKEKEKIYVQKTVFRPKSFTSLTQAHRWIEAEREGKMYIIQQGLKLAKIKGRPFDVRVMVQRERPGGQWVYSGMLAKIAGKGSIVTNVALSKGDVMEVTTALQQGLGWTKTRAQTCAQDLIDVTLQAANHFDGYLKYRELGLDMAIDEKGRIWIIEENTAPSHPLFAHLKSNLSMYQTIQKRWGLYNRARKKSD
jgi:hypothetical protein